MFCKDRMYAADLSNRDRAGPITGVVLVHVALGAMLLGLSGHLAPSAVQQTIKLFDVREAPPPQPPPPPPPPKKARAKPEPVKASGGSAPNKKSEATPIVAPKPKIEVPTPNPVIASINPQQGIAPTQGLAPLAGPGTGSGGSGNGSGGGNGSGNGGGGDDGNDTHPQPLYARINPRSFSRELTEYLPRGARVFIIFDVQLDGSITGCTVRQSSGDPQLDSTVCQLAEQRFRYQPARHGDGTPFVAKSAYMQVF